jgi:hypothetical protein
MTDVIKQGKSLIDYFVQSYESLYHKKPLINRNTAKWAARDLVDSFGLEESKSAIDWYFYVKETGHDWSWYSNNIEKLIIARNQKEKDDRDRMENRERARAWLNE